MSRPELTEERWWEEARKGPISGQEATESCFPSGGCPVIEYANRLEFIWNLVCVPAVRVSFHISIIVSPTSCLEWDTCASWESRNTGLTCKRMELQCYTETGSFPTPVSSCLIPPLSITDRKQLLKSKYIYWFSMASNTIYRNCSRFYFYGIQYLSINIQYFIMDIPVVKNDRLI